MPSAILMLLFAFSVRHLSSSAVEWLLGLQIVAVAVVAQAVIGMARTLAPDWRRRILAVFTAGAVLLWNSFLSQLVLILLGAIIGRWLLEPLASTISGRLQRSVSRRIGLISLSVFAILLISLPILRRWTSSQPIAIFDSFFRVGSLVFGGGHVILPLLQTTVVSPGWVTNQQFVTGYGAAQAVPGPLTTFAAYLGAVMRVQPNGLVGGSLALIAIFLPSFLLVIGTLPFYDQLRRRSDFRAALQGVNAVVVGLILAALYRPLWTSAIHSVADAALAIASLALLSIWKLPPWLVVAFALAGGIVIHARSV
jgi:chromate transporter